MSSSAHLAMATLLLIATVPCASAQQRSIAGRVLSSGSLRPVDGALISIKGTPLSTRSDAQGRFAFSVIPSEHITLVVKRPGYRPLSRLVRMGDLAVELVMAAAAVVLERLVVTGTAGDEETRSVGQAVATVDVPTVLQTAPFSDLQHVLTAKVPGMLLLSPQGNVGSGGRTQLRGVSSLILPNEPLLYVDGVRVDNNPRAGPDIRNRRQVARINDFNAEDIERVEVVRGPAASTLYGTDASHGVIHIITRRGLEGPLRFSVTARLHDRRAHLGQSL
jgi:outer membrane receptor protein involved in Fe transport